MLCPTGSVPRPQPGHVHRPERVRKLDLGAEFPNRLTTSSSTSSSRKLTSLSEAYVKKHEIDARPLEVHAYLAAEDMQIHAVRPHLNADQTSP